MSPIRFFFGWMLDGLAWLGEPELRPERGALALLLASILVLAGWGQSLGPMPVGVFWIFVLVSVALLLRRPALWLVGPLPFYEILRTTRRGRHVLLRCLYAGALL